MVGEYWRNIVPNVQTLSATVHVKDRIALVFIKQYY